MNIDVKQIEEALKVISILFTKHNIEYWLEAGTLLGIIREDRILPYDSDGDVSFPVKYAPKIASLASEFKKYGYKLSGNMIFQLTKNGNHIICMMPAKRYGNNLHKAESSVFNILKIPSALVSWLLIIKTSKAYNRGDADNLRPIKYIRFKGRQYPIPNKVYGYLENHYPDWEYPIKDKRTNNQSGYIIFPCKCDPIHTGHILQIKKLIDIYGIVIVDIYDYDNRVMRVSTVKEILKELFGNKVRFLTHDESYTYSKPNTLNRIPFATGNSVVYNNLISNGFKVVKVKRIPKYSSTMLRRFYAR